MTTKKRPSHFAENFYYQSGITPTTPATSHYLGLSSLQVPAWK